MIVVGSFGLSQSTTAAENSLVPVPAYAAAGGLSPTGIVLDPRSQHRYFVADFTNLFGTRNQGVTFTNLTANLMPFGIIRPTALEFISNNGVDALLTGGLNNVANAQSPIAIADSDADGALSNWRPFGTGLPNSQVNALSYNPTVDVLAVGTFGRGVFTLYDVTSYFPQATVLQFGLADNDSQPDASFLTDGTSLNGTRFSRPLNKYGTGMLTIAGDATYTGGTSIFGGALQLGTGGSSGSILGNVAFCSDASNPLCDASTNKMLVFNRSDTYSFDGAISGPGQVVQVGSGKTVLTAVNTYSGPTFVNAGTLSVNGSIASSPVFVNFGGTLGGNGTVGPTMVLPGGVLSPGEFGRHAHRQRQPRPQCGQSLHGGSRRRSCRPHQCQRGGESGGNRRGLVSRRQARAQLHDLVGVRRTDRYVRFARPNKPARLRHGEPRLHGDRRRVEADVRHSADY
jgi:autotransporter-associated beta strand protein